MLPRSLLLAAVCLLLAAPSRAQDADTTLVLDPIEVTAERSVSALSASTSAISVVTPRQLRTLPNRSAGDLLAQVPGLTFLDFDGLGYAPQSVTRGFYGGGEAEYVVVLLNGRPINNLENGLVNWEQVVLGPEARIEVLRGGSSSLYGDAAIGAVVNILAEDPIAPTRNLTLSGGTLGHLTARAHASAPRYTVSGSFSSNDGYRDHSGRSAGTLGGTYQLADAVSVHGSFTTRDFDTPGPLRTVDVALGDQASLPFFRYDGAAENDLRAGLEGAWETPAGQLVASISGNLRNQDLVRTLPLSAEFADTQVRDVDAKTLRASVQFSEAVLPIGISNRIVIGSEASTGSLDSRYTAVATGGEDAYTSASMPEGEELSRGTATRQGAAAFSHLEVMPTPALKVSLGGRFDWIRDGFDGEGAEDATHTAFSPKVGVNARYVSSATQVGHVYLSASRSFKAPTLDQLYDLRAFPVPFPPFSIRIASDQLIPQEGVSLEAGVYHTAALGEDLLGRLSVAAYTMDMENEIDFSFETFSNVSIGKSRHRGVEAALSLDHDDGGFGFLNYTLQDVTLQSGDHTGNHVKAVPRHSVSAGLSAPIGPVDAGATLRSLNGMWVDDANTVELDGYATMDLRVAWTRQGYGVTLDAYNVLDTRYNGTAYPDPAGSDVLFVFPAAGRTLVLGLSLSL
ncbi:MAG: TonB-dependent receptor [Rhodothermales bacterium]|nr:TonB-dependent receptor [Rhodothermales bacterium]